MRFVLPARIVDDQASWDDLERLRLRIVEEVHILELPDADELEDSGWFRGLRPHQREHLRRLVRAGSYEARPGPGEVHSRTIVIGTDLDVRRAVRLAHETLLVLVENVNTDGILVKAAVAAHGSEELRRLWSLESLTGPPVKLHSRGGTGELLKEVKAICGAAGTAGIPPRLVVVTESDKRWAEDASQKATEIDRDCRNLGVPCLVLGCKSIENYIPDAAFDAWVSDISRTTMRPAIAALKRLSSAEQRDHFPMKGKTAQSRGFAAVDRPGAPAELQHLFAGVPQADRDALRSGFRDDIICLLDVTPPLTAADLDSRDTRGELRRVVAMIAEAL